MVLLYIITSECFSSRYIVFDGTAVKKVSSVKYLGVHIDDDLTPTTVLVVGVRSSSQQSSVQKAQ